MPDGLMQMTLGVALGVGFATIIGVQLYEVKVEPILAQCEEWKNETFEVDQIKDGMKIYDNKQSCYIYPRESRTFITQCFQPPK